jgi:hypothetical protein
MGARARARKTRLLTMRAELAILLENRLDPRHLQLNMRSTSELLEHVREFNLVPLKFGAYTPHSTWWDEARVLPEDLRGLPKLLDDQVFEDAVKAFAQGVDEALLRGTGIVRLTSTG